MYEARERPETWCIIDPVILVAPPISQCLSCCSPLRFQRVNGTVNILTTTGAKKGFLLKADCRGRAMPCEILQYYVDSYVTHSTASSSPYHKKRVMYNYDILTKTGILRLDHNNYMLVQAAEIWAVRIPVILGSNREPGLSSLELDHPESSTLLPQNSQRDYVEMGARFLHQW
ncbi:hypothetical protein BC829DRAFT_414264 [Chytridium lagenaria]|nr:hypothetical protein BC829DRAFT_414264 [Chytridium lagenaria]